MSTQLYAQTALGSCPVLLPYHSYSNVGWSNKSQFLWQHNNGVSPHKLHESMDAPCLVSIQAAAAAALNATLSCVPCFLFKPFSNETFQIIFHRKKPRSASRPTALLVIIGIVGTFQKVVTVMYNYFTWPLRTKMNQ